MVLAPMYQNLEQFIEEAKVDLYNFHGGSLDQEWYDFFEKKLRQCAELTVEVLEASERSTYKGFPKNMKLNSLLTRTAKSWLNKE